MASYGAYYYSGGRPETRQESLRPDAVSKKEEVRSPAPPRYDRPKTPGSFIRRRSVTPPDEERVPYNGSAVELERPRNPGSMEERERSVTTSYGERPTTVYNQPSTVSLETRQITRPPERVRPVSPDYSIFSEITEPEIKPDYTSVDFYTYSKCLERVVSDANLTMPITLGVYGKWGSGKSRLTQGVLWCMKQACSTRCSHIREPVEAPRVRWIYRACYCCDMPFTAYLFMLFLLLTIIVTTVSLVLVLSVEPLLQGENVVETVTNITATQTITISTVTMSTIEKNQSQILVAILSMTAVVLFVIFLACCLKCCKDRYLRGAGEMLSHFRALIVMTLCDTPPPPSDPTAKVEMIPISFNAAEFADTTDVWSAMAEVMLNGCEDMFGYWKSRLFRVSTHDLEHEHDALIANDERWRTAPAEKKTRSMRGLPSGIANSKHRHNSEANHTPKQQQRNRFATTPGPKNKPNQNQTQNQNLAPVIRKPSSLTIKSNKIVATEEISYMQVDVPVHTAKWRSIPYPMLITISLAMMISGVIVLVIVTTSIETISASFTPYYYTIVVGCALLIGLPLLSQVKNLVILLHSLCTSPSLRLQRMRKHCYDDNRMSRKDIHGYMHNVKGEIAYLMGFLREMEHIYQRKFRILLVVEDLDKCPDSKIFEVLQALKVIYGHPGFPIVTMLNLDPDQINKSLKKTGIESGYQHLNQLIDMRYCVPDTEQSDLMKFLECHTEHLLCSTSTRVNRLKEVSDRKYKTETYRQRRRELIRQLDVQHDFEESGKPVHEESGYYSYPTSGRPTATARTLKSSKSKRRVVFTPIASTSEEGLEGPPPKSPPTQRNPLPPVDKSVVPPVNKPEPEQAASPGETRRVTSTTVTSTANDRRPPTADRPESQLSRVRSPIGMMKRENSTLHEESSDEEEDNEDPEWILAMTGGEARKEKAGTVSMRRPQLADSEKTEEQIALQQISAIAEMKVLLGTPHNLSSALVNNPRHEIVVDYDDALAKLHQIPTSSVTVQNLPKEKVKRHILAYGLRRKIVYLAADEVRHHMNLLDSSFSRMSQLFNNVYLCTYIWVQKLKQLGFVDAVMGDDTESDKAMVKLIHTCHELTRWIILCELWPYKASWIIYKVERVNRKMGDFPSSNFYLESSIRDIYNEIKLDIKAAKEEFPEYQTLDNSNTSFKKALEKFKDISGLSVLRYLPFTVHIDRTWKNRINTYMSEKGKARSSDQSGDGMNQPSGGDDHNEEEEEE